MSEVTARPSLQPAARHAEIPSQEDSTPYIETIPNEVLLLIFSFTGIEDLIPVSAVCSRFHRLATDPLLWKAFCRSLPDSPLANRTCFKEEDNVDVEIKDYRRLACQCSCIPSNIALDRFVLESPEDPYPTDAIRVYQSHDALCVARPDGKIEIYNPDTHFLEVYMTCEPPSGEKIKQLRTLCSGFRSVITIARNGQQAHLQSALTHFEELKKIVQDEELNCYFADCIEPLNNIIESMKRGNCQLLQILPFLAQYIGLLDNLVGQFFQMHNLVSDPEETPFCFTASPDFFAIAYSPGYTEIWDRRTLEKISFWSPQGITRLHFCHDKLFFLAQGIPYVFAIKEKVGKPYALRCLLSQKVDENHLLVVDSLAHVFCFDVETETASLIFSSDFPVLDICFDSVRAKCAYIRRIPSDNLELVIVNLDHHFKLSSDDPLIIPLPGFRSISVIGK